MNKYKNYLLGILLTVGFVSCSSNKDNASKLLINEVLTDNVTNFQDDYGIHSAWIEIFNKSYGSVDLAGCLLKVSNTPGDTIVYIIPKGDILTTIKPRQHALFWADAKFSRGTFHTSFKLDAERPNWIGLYDSGNKLLDQITVPILDADKSYARIKDAAKEWEIKGESVAKYVTPSTNNQTIEKNEKVEKFAQHDNTGIGMSVSAMSVVFVGLLLLYVIFRTLGKAVYENKGRKTDKQPVTVMKQEETVKKTPECTDEVYAAIAIALALHEELGGIHDIESNILTIRHLQSPWNVKYNALRVAPEKIPNTIINKLTSSYERI